MASLWHLPVNALHLSVSVVKLERNRGKNTWIKYQLKTKAFWFLWKSHRNSAIRKNLNLFEGFLLFVFSGRTFQLSYYFWALLAVTILSIWHTNELLLFCRRKASNIKANKKIKQKQTKTDTKTKKTRKKQERSTQTKTKQKENIQKANEEYITHAQWNIVTNLS